MRSRYKIEINNDIYFVTSTIQNWISVFTSDIYFLHLIEAIKYNQQNKDLKIYAYVIMSNHFHMICRSEYLSNVMTSIKSYTAKKIISELKKENRINILEKFRKYKLKSKSDSVYQIWQEGYHPKQIISEKEFEQKMNYIHFNPVGKELVDSPELWKYSSYNNYYGGDTLIELDLV